MVFRGSGVVPCGGNLRKIGWMQGREAMMNTAKALLAGLCLGLMVQRADAVQCLNIKSEQVGSTVICYFECSLGGGQVRIFTRTYSFPQTCPLYIDM
jgi:hypothetical protein